MSCIASSRLCLLAVAAGAHAMIAAPAQAEDGAEPAVAVAVSVAAAAGANRGSVRIDEGQLTAPAAREQHVAAPRVAISVQRASNLVGNPSSARKENFGEGAIAGSFSTRPVTVRGQAGSSPSGMPLANMRLSSRFGDRRHPIHGGWSRHAGIDLAAPYGTPIMATGSGVVTRAGSSGGYGLMVGLDHGGGMETRYAHMSRYIVRPGDRVSEGQVIGYVGSTGNSTGPHLHYEMLVGGRPVNPLD